jgi:glyoxylase-like metal-dependent hydrolase (beta-lactamase superfamily II)
MSIAAVVGRGRTILAAIVGALAAAVGEAALGADVADLPMLKVAQGIYVFPGAQGDASPANLGRTANVTAIVGSNAVVLVDSGTSFHHGETILRSVRRLTPAPVRLVVLTHPSQDVVFGATAFQANGIPVLMHRDAAALMEARCGQCLQRLETTLGAVAMAGTRIAAPDRLISASTTIDYGRPLRLLAPEHGSAPGALAVFDPATGTVIAGSLAAVGQIPDMRDSEGADWRSAVALLAATRCSHLIAAHGPPADCSALAGLDRYFKALDARVRELLAEGVGLADVASRCELPEFSAWEGYATLHRANANRAFLRVERETFDR